MLTFSINNPVFEEDGVKCTFKRCVAKTFNEWLLTNDKIGTINISFKFDEKLKEKVIDTSKLSHKEMLLLKKIGVLFMSDRLINIEGLKDSETGEKIDFEILSKEREFLENFIDMLFEQSEKFNEFFLKFKDGAEKKSK